MVFFSSSAALLAETNVCCPVSIAPSAFFTTPSIFLEASAKEELVSFKFERVMFRFAMVVSLKTSVFSF